MVSFCVFSIDYNYNIDIGQSLTTFDHLRLPCSRWPHLFLSNHANTFFRASPTLLPSHLWDSYFGDFWKRKKLARFEPRPSGCHAGATSRPRRPPLVDNVWDFSKLKHKDKDTPADLILEVSKLINNVRVMRPFCAIKVGLK